MAKIDKDAMRVVSYWLEQTEKSMEKLTNGINLIPQRQMTPDIERMKRRAMYMNFVLAHQLDEDFRKLVASQD